MKRGIRDTAEYDLHQQINDLEAMLEHASATIARLEGAWRSARKGPPMTGKAGYLVIERETLDQYMAEPHRGIWYVIPDGEEVHVIAWRELPQLPSSDGYGDLT